MEIQEPAHLSQAELSALHERVEAMNFALYRTAGEAALSHGALKHLCRQAGLGRLVANLFSESSGVSEIRVATHGARRGEYIPYGNRALNWHTDGYYQPPAQPIDGFAMHTVRAAAAGGQNCFLDPEILYLLLRERDAGLAACLFDAGGDDHTARHRGGWNSAPGAKRAGVFLRRRVAAHAVHVAQARRLLEGFGGGAGGAGGD